MNLEKRVEVLEKRVAELEGLVQEQPQKDVGQISIDISRMFKAAKKRELDEAEGQSCKLKSVEMLHMSEALGISLRQCYAMRLKDKN